MNAHLKYEKKKKDGRYREVSVDFMARVIGTLVEERTTYSHKDIALLLNKAFGTMSRDAIQTVTHYGVRCNYLNKTGATKGTRYWLVNRPASNEKVDAVVAAIRGTPVTPKATQAQAPQASEPTPATKLFPTGDPAKEPMPDGDVLSRVWHHSKVVGDGEGGLFLITTTKVRIR